MTQCPKCKRQLPEEEFPVVRGGGGLRHDLCRRCMQTEYSQRSRGMPTHTLVVQQAQRQEVMLTVMLELREQQRLLVGIRQDMDKLIDEIGEQIVKLEELCPTEPGTVMLEGTSKNDRPQKCGSKKRDEAAHLG